MSTRDDKMAHGMTSVLAFSRKDHTQPRAHPKNNGSMNKFKNERMKNNSKMATSKMKQKEKMVKPGKT